MKLYGHVYYHVTLNWVEVNLNWIRDIGGEYIQEMMTITFRA